MSKKAEYIFEKLAQDFQGYVGSKKKLSKEKEKALLNRGYRQVSGSEYADMKGNVVSKGLSEGLDKGRTKVNKDTKALPIHGGFAGAAVGLGMGLASKSNKVRGISAIGGGLLGTALGYSGRKNLRNKFEEKADKVTKEIDRQKNVMKDVYSVEDADRKFFVKTPK